MKPIAMLLMPVAVLVAAAPAVPRGGARGPETDQAQSGAHVNRHIDAHVPAREGEPAAGTEAPTPRRPARDPFRGWHNQAPTPPSAGQPLRDRRY